MPSKRMQAKSGTPAVLVIEATKFQRRSLCRLIRAAGADHVAEALDPTDAARVLGRGRHPEWIVVADPDLIGPDAMVHLKGLADRFPIAGTLMLTHRKGAADELRESAHGHGLRLLTVLRKPVSAEEMGTLLRQFSLASNNALARPPVLTKEELSECLRDGSLRAKFQPRIDLESGRPVCCEAQPYVTHPVHGAVPAAQFHQAVAQLGAQRVMTASVLRDAAELVRQLRDQSLDTRVAVPLGPDVLSESGDASSLDAYVRTLGISASDLQIEVTPGADAATDPVTIDNLARLKLRGYQLVLTEQNPVGSLAEPVYAHFSEVRLAWSDAPATMSSERPGSIADLLASARRHGLTTCAVGIPPSANLDDVRRTGFEYAQGDLIACSMTTDEVLAWVRREAKAPSFATRMTSPREAADAFGQGA